MSLTYRKGWREDGVAITDSPRIGLDFADPSLPTLPMSSEFLSETRFVLSEPMRLAAVFPVLDEAAAGHPFELIVRHADGTEEVILSIEVFSPEWREKYVLSAPPNLVQGDELRLSAASVWLDFLPPHSPSGQ